MTTAAESVPKHDPLAADLTSAGARIKLDEWDRYIPPRRPIVPHIRIGKRWIFIGIAAASQERSGSSSRIQYRHTAGRGAVEGLQGDCGDRQDRRGLFCLSSDLKSAAPRSRRGSRAAAP